MTMMTPYGVVGWEWIKKGIEEGELQWPMILLNPLTSVSHCSGFKVKLTFHGIQFLDFSLYTRQILGILCLQVDWFLIVECIWYILGHV